MSRRPSASQPLAALLVAVVLAVLAGLLGPVAPATAATSTGAATATRPEADRGPVLFGHDAVPAQATSNARALIAWRGSRLYYRETLPASWDWSLRTAVAKWNASGSRIKLVPTTSRRQAQVTVSYGETGGAAGLATIGRVRGAFVELSSAYDSADPTSAHTRVEVMGVLAHELGHVLGFDHSTTACSLMGPVLDVAGCGTVSEEHPGAYVCRTIDAPLLARFVRLYGGTARLVPEGWCLIDPVPGTLRGVTVTTSPAGELVVTWSRPATVPAGAAVELAHWNGDCAQRPVDTEVRLAAVSTGRWVGDEASVSSCLTVGMVNRYGLAGGRTAVTVPRAAVATTEVPPPTP